MTDDSPASGSRPKLLDSVRQAIRLRHYSRRTEQAYVGWIRRFIVLNGKRHPRELGEHEVTAFLSGLAARGVSASTQNQAPSAILFLYEVVIGERLAWMNGIVRAQRPVRLPVVLSRDEVSSLLSRLRGPVWLMASLMYGAGLRLLECAELRVKDLNFDRGELTIRDGKGGKDRVTMLPAAVKHALVDHLTRVKAQHNADLALGRGNVALPGALRTKYPNAPREWAWQWVFPATRFYGDRETGERRRHHLHESVLQRAVKDAAKAAGIARPATSHILVLLPLQMTVSGSLASRLNPALPSRYTATAACVQPAMGTSARRATLSGVRRITLSRIRYYVYYRVADDALQVLALWHTSRGLGPSL